MKKFLLFLCTLIFTFFPLSCKQDKATNSSESYLENAPIIYKIIKKKFPNNAIYYKQIYVFQEQENTILEITLFDNNQLTKFRFQNNNWIYLGSSSFTIKGKATIEDFTFKINSSKIKLLQSQISHLIKNKNKILSWEINSSNIVSKSNIPYYSITYKSDNKTNTLKNNF